MSLFNAISGTQFDSFNQIVSDMNSKTTINPNKNDSFQSLFNSALDMLNTTNDYQIAAQEAEMNFAMGFDTNTHTLQAAQNKANLSLQYTVAVKNKVIEAYNQIMNLSI